MYGDGLSARRQRYSVLASKSCGVLMRRASSTWKTSPARMYSLMRSTSRSKSSRAYDEVPSAGCGVVRERDRLEQVGAVQSSDRVVQVVAGLLQ